ncbi:probable WRKY transcription factor 75 [Mercurialis annua]|uniref:probable WRKY transcription factor 75 n=1 Tax=Mercurialis annua TaxID=3986 RepID=UPI00215E1C99|nr:probable WRKY transcription factor 75 [Mercurialis annua]
MEKFQILFPYSSSPTQPSSITTTNNYSVSSNMTNNSHVLANFEGNNNNSYAGFLELKLENDQVGSSVPEPELGMDINSGSFGESDEIRSSKKRGEKKIKKQRYAFQTRSRVDILDDGYRWRKYGQKAVKHNKFPRSYYRCTHQGCNVKKQVQRLTKDEDVVVTTYEGMHTHPIQKQTDNFEHILSQMQIYTPF